MLDSKLSMRWQLSLGSSNSVPRGPTETILLHGLASRGILLETEGLPFEVVLASLMTLRSKTSQPCNSRRNARWNRMKRSHVRGSQDLHQHGVSPEPASWLVTDCFRNWFHRRP